MSLIVSESNDKNKFLFGRPWLDTFFPEWRKQMLSMSVSISNVSISSIVASFVKLFPKIFDPNNNDAIKFYSAKFIMKEDHIPFRHPPYNPSYALISVLEEKLKVLQSKGLLEKVSFSEYASPVVLVPKRDGTYRMCVDFKKTINKQLNVEYYPLPNIEDIFAHLSGGKVFTVLDLSDAYLQLKLDPESRKYVTINTHKGLFVFTRLIYGIASAPAIFQGVMDDILRDLENVFCFIDDILVKGINFDDCVEKTKLVLHKLNEYNVRLNLQKCTWFVPEVNYLGYVITGDGRKPNPDKVMQILEMATPTSAKQVSTFLGMLSFNSVFCPNLSTVVKPLRHLTEKNVPFTWSPECQKSFDDAKKLLSSDSVLMHFDPKLPIGVSADASPVGLGGCLYHVVEINGVKRERPVIFVSCTLTPTQQAYAQIDREAFALVFVVTRLRKFLWARKFTLCTDNQPIAHIFNPGKGVPIQAAHRLQHWAVILQGFQYTLCHRKSELMATVDALSRLPSKETFEDNISVNFVSPQELPINVSVCSTETVKDPVMNKVMSLVYSGWYGTKPTDEALRQYFNVRNDLSILQKCLMIGNRICVPPTLRKAVLQMLHNGHPGIVRMKALARMYVWWPGMSEEIELFCNQCNSCAVVNIKESKVFVPWPEAKHAFERVHIDFFELTKVNFFIYADSYSKWLHVQRMSSTDCVSVITVLMSIFANVGYPKKLVADNGPPFCAEDFVAFLTKCDIVLLHSPPYSPASNGQAERSVQIAKKALKKMFLDVPSTQSSSTEVLYNSVADQHVSSFLLTYRNTPTTTTGKTPNELIFSFRPRNPLSGLLPLDSPQLKSLPFRDGEKVLVKLSKRHPVVEGVVVRYLGGTRYAVNIQGVIREPHINQLSRNPKM